MQASKIDQTYIDDSLRIMRNVRFATRYGFKISDPTWKSMKKKCLSYVYYYTRTHY